MDERPDLQVTSHTQDEVTRLAALRGQTVDDTVADAVRLLRQEEVSRALTRALNDDDVAWLDADLR